MDNLALRLRPKSLTEFFGQKHLCAKDGAFYHLLQNKTVPNCIFFGPAGVGKTTLARIVAHALELPFYELDATSLKVEEFRKILHNHKNALQKPVIFIDEVHRLSKTQQEVLLIPMENRDAIIIAASTENPYFTLSSGIRSRSMLFEFYDLNDTDMLEILQKAQQMIHFEIDADAKAYLIASSGGDARSLLNLLEFAIKVNLHVSLQILKSLRPNALSDGVSKDETHYDLISALIKSVRGSDVDAGLYYLARLIDGGESADFIARRLVVLASEDIGNANPQALNLATSALLAVSKIGFPEARIILSQTLIYLTCSPKSNAAYNAINTALEYVKTQKKLPIPKHLTNSGKNAYVYPHDFGGWVAQKYISKKVTFFQHNNIAFEKTLHEWLQKIKREV
ncbi:MAG: replication-associated recombination protein A [Sulfurospirillum sp.]|nr:replication-associated recombination protein A [Sulfurospirillum sp.]